ncbi:unnamed protein product, partial [marine sediment metagenome]
MLIVPRVVMMGGILAWETNKPFIEPSRSPMAMEIKIIIKIGIPG